MSYNQKNLDVRRTIETTMQRAQGYCFGKYPSIKNPSTNIRIDIRYPGEVIPPSEIELFSFPVSRFDLTQKPIGIIIKRGETEIYLKRETFSNTKFGKKGILYFFHSCPIRP